ncbi:hypothetical protein TVAG_275650 [Trichomonas vaginalis G3]|uniref:Uncharacterized protein n=1 Tax=Trichomonas vaginalis (strain ATCC PRA-98 / G3) TaxID=412133 RepID=A2EYD8_TRIV3|nr:hypothetical protein TVAGG3_0863930 [Trichomonas vaginalis G3]EAY02291.1 hypothetical protein TVAG_275650 [Trichomonas vaginalis G3]KAI5500874.1 hypothetical protein TVAGG3_0863930 [Trichomonas vaginalis G3]|eukprot:XP_001314606.1 hypothetical protein [Trichomonas vaginalis G3]
MYQDCAHKSKTTIYTNDYPVLAVHSDEAAEEIFKVNAKPQGTTVVTINSKLKVSFKDAVSLFSELLPSECEISYVKGIWDVMPTSIQGEHVTIGSTKTDLLKTFKSQLSQIPDGSTKYSQVKPYLSIVLTGAADMMKGKFTEFLQKYINSVGKMLDLVPEASCEIVIVEIPKKGENYQFNLNLRAPKSLQGKVRIIEGPTDKYDGSHYPEFLAKNIGIRRAFGDFVLISDPTVILPITFFDILARNWFNKGVVYRGNIYQENGSMPENDLIRLAEESFTHSLDDFENQCLHRKGFYIIKGNIDTDKDIGCDSLFFTLASKELWYAISGYNEYPFNDKLDIASFAKFMKIVPGIPIHYFPFPLFKKNMEGYPPLPQDIIDLNPKDITNQYFCSGDASAVKHYGDSPRWGLPTTVLKVYVK